MTKQQRLKAIRQRLIPWHRHWDTLADDQDPEPLPEGVLDELRSLVADFPQSEDALRELAQLEALVGDIPAAIGTLKQLVALPGKRPKQRSQDCQMLAHLEKKLSEDPQQVLLTRKQSDDLVSRVDEHVRAEGCDHSLRHTLAWASENNIDTTRLTATLAHFGCFCDCEVVLNLPLDEDVYVVREEENRE